MTIAVINTARQVMLAVIGESQAPSQVNVRVGQPPAVAMDRSSDGRLIDLVLRKT